MEIKQEDLPDDNTEYTIPELGALIHLAAKKSEHHFRFNEMYLAHAELNRAMYYHAAIDQLLRELEIAIEESNDQNILLQVPRN